MIFFQTIKKLFIIYFTSFPYIYYNYTTNIGNLALTGISLGLIKYQKYFLIGNTSTIILIINRQYINFYYYYIGILFLCFLNFYNIHKTLRLIKYIDFK